MKYRLGLDIGANSIGWVCLLLDDLDHPCGLLDLGVRVYPDGRNPKDGSSLAVARRVPRGMRRRRDRYLARRLAGRMARALAGGGSRIATAFDRVELISDALTATLARAGGFTVLTEDAHFATLAQLAPGLTVLFYDRNSAV
jgi:CRISPR/Cas system Type II protein with McrA/HNH and RuvC-like nuclease domain